MKFHVTFLASGLVASAWASAAPQDVASPVTTSASSTVSLSPQQTCLAKCPVNDVGCKALCINVPSPNDAQVNQTTTCASNCKQGSGSQADTDAYSQCVQNCISSYYLSSHTVLATDSVSTAAATATATATMTGTTTHTTATTNSSGASSTSTTTATTATTSGSTTRTTTTSAASSTSSGAAGSLQMGTSLAGLAGLLVALVGM